MAEQQEQSKPPVPAWRAELSERVREIRAKKEGADTARPLASPLSSTTPAATAAAPAETVRPVISPAKAQPVINSREREKLGSITKTKFPARSLSGEREVTGMARVENSATGRAGNNPLVQAALSRVQRASENARRSSLSRIEPSRPGQAASALAIDREATARVLEQPLPDLEAQPVIESRPLPQERRITQPLASVAAKPAPDSQRVPGAAQTATTSSATALRTSPLVSTETVERIARPELHTEAVKKLDEEHCLDYLEVEVERVDRELHQGMMTDEEITLSTHVMINLVDICVIGISCAPFLAIIKSINGSFEEPGTIQAAGLISLMVATFYLALTHLLANRTFGMMFTGTKLVAASHPGKPTPWMMLLRTVGYSLSLAPGLAGFFWIALDPEHRSWHDRLSGTIVTHE